MADDRLRITLKVPNVSEEKFAKLNAFIVSRKNCLPLDVAGPSRCVELSASEPDNKNDGLLVTLLVTMEYPYSGGGQSRKKTSRKIVKTLFDCMGLFP